MRFLLLLIFAPAFAMCQTVHIKKKRIYYEGTIKVTNSSQSDLYNRTRQALVTYVTGNAANIEAHESKRELTAAGAFRLKSVYHIIKTLQYIITLKITDSGVQYHIDSVYIKQKERNGKTTLISSEELFKGMDVSGTTAIETEKQLNEIDMDIEKLLDLMTNFLERPNQKRS